SCKSHGKVGSGLLPQHVTAKPDTEQAKAGERYQMTLLIDRRARTRASISRRTLVKRGLAAGLATMGGALSLPQAHAQSAPQRGGTLRVAQENDISSFDPH